MERGEGRIPYCDCEAFARDNNKTEDRSMKPLRKAILGLTAWLRTQPETLFRNQASRLKNADF